MTARPHAPQRKGLEQEIYALLITYQAMRIETIRRSATLANRRAHGGCRCMPAIPDSSKTR